MLINHRRLKSKVVATIKNGSFETAFGVVHYGIQEDYILVLMPLTINDNTNHNFGSFTQVRSKIKKADCRQTPIM